MELSEKRLDELKSQLFFLQNKDDKKEQKSRYLEYVSENFDYCYTPIQEFQKEIIINQMTILKKEYNKNAPEQELIDYFIEFIREKSGNITPTEFSDIETEEEEEEEKEEEEESLFY